MKPRPPTRNRHVGQKRCLVSQERGQEGLEYSYLLSLSPLEYGWNDPPQFSYQSDNAKPNKHSLKKRPAYPATQRPHHVTGALLSRDEPPPTTLSRDKPPPIATTASKVVPSCQGEATPTVPDEVLLSQVEVLALLNKMNELHKEGTEVLYLMHNNNYYYQKLSNGLIPLACSQTTLILNRQKIYTLSSSFLPPSVSPSSSPPLGKNIQRDQETSRPARQTMA